ncbi:MAG TPA: hypothetical protein VG454_02065 [Gemmatimonadales bacterium]|nr:hypothetical protein [Gemmatimonadales bacterium]
MKRHAVIEWVARLTCALLPLIAACQPSARRLLLLDMNAGDPLALEATAAPWHDAGYRVEYRRFYPHLTRADLTRYRTVVILGGREPQGLSDALTVGDLAILNEWIGGGRDGVVVFAYTSDGEGPRGPGGAGPRNPVGTLDRWIMNQWLASQGAGITIESEPLDAPAVPLPSSSLDNAGFAPFPAGRNQLLEVRDPTQVLARAPSSAFVAASRVNEGLIVVTGRNLLASVDLDPLSHDYLVALARWTRRPAEWASVRAAVRPAPLRLMGAPRQVETHPPPLGPPDSAGAVLLPQHRGTTEEEKTIVPSWITRQGMRVFWTRFTPQTFESDLGFVDVAALNALATVIPTPAIADTIGTRNLWRNAVERLQTTSVRWFPAVALVDISTQGAEEVDRHGDLRPIPCGLDSLFWRSELRPTYRTLARLGGAQPRAEVIAGIALDMDSALTYYGGTGFCDADYRTGLAGLGLDRAEVARLALLPPPQRYDTLLERGFLGRYYDTLQATVAERARTLRAELRRLRPDLRFAFRSDEFPADWFSLGMLQGFSSADAPVLLWVRDTRGAGHAAEVLARYRERGIYALSALRLEPDRNTFSTNGWTRIRPVVFGAYSGFWLDRAAPDSIGRLIRRVVR